MREAQIKRLNELNIGKNNINFLIYHYLIPDIQNAIDNYAKGKLLDVGCGNKPYYSLFKKNIEYIGCDVVQSSDQKVDIICPASQLAVENDSFDTVFSTQVLEHVEDGQKMIDETFRVLKQGGNIILSCPMYWHLHEEPYDFFRFTKYGLKYMFERAGYEIILIKENGGKYSVLGLTLLHTFPKLPKILKRLLNSLFLFLDTKYYETNNTSNYVVIAKKP